MIVADAFFCDPNNTRPGVLRLPAEGGVGIAAVNAEPYRLDGMLGEGSFSRVFRATRRDEGGARAIKLAKPPDELGPAATPTGVVETGVFAWVTGALLDVEPDASEILRVQFDTLKAIDSPDLVGVRELGADADQAWYAMDLVEGRPLRRPCTKASSDRQETVTPRPGSQSSSLRACAVSRKTRRFPTTVT
ncbi:MAG: hypothetical protein M5T61_20900 [Acidimicrobiia bacterium]|nr:hypothetical protein [Acidimicrobiia bacterium]